MDKRSLKVASLYALGALVPIGLSVGLARPAQQYGPGVEASVIVVAVAWALAFTGMAWKRTDEAAQEAHKFAWFWGAPFALVALLMALPIVAVTVFHARFQSLAQAWDGGSPWTLLIAGVALAAVVQAAGYLLVWAGWWMRHR